MAITDSFNVSTSGTSFVLPELLVLIAHLEILGKTHLSQDDVNILLDIAMACQQNNYVIHAVFIYALLYRYKEKSNDRDTHTPQFYQEQLTPLLNQKPCESKQIAFQSAQGILNQPLVVKEADTWIDVALCFKQSALMHYLLNHCESDQGVMMPFIDKETCSGIIEIESETVLHRLCCSGIADLSLYQQLVEMWPQALSARTSDFHLPLHKAACFVNQNVFNYLAEKTTKAWVQADSQGNTLLHLAAEYANTEVVKQLLQQEDVNVNALNENKRTPLHCAAAGRQLGQGSTLADYEAVFNSLLMQGAEPTCVDSYRKTARDIARVSENSLLLDVFDKALNRTKPERLWQHWQSAMMSYYTKETFVRKRLFNDDYFSLADYFVNLQVIRKQDNVADGQQPSGDKPVYKPLRERDRPAGKKRSVKLRDLFQSSIYQYSDENSLPSTNTIVVSGAAGVGKTTLVDYLAYQWALSKQEQGEAGLWSAFESVLIIRCRDLHPEQMGFDVRTITQLLHRACWGSLRLSDDDVPSLLIRLEQSPAKCLLLLDGLDELPEPKQAYWHNLLVQLFQLPFKKLVTTRPYAIEKLQQWISHEGLVEISGFTDDNVVVYFEKALGQSNETQDFIQAVKKNQDLWAITHIPIHAYLLKSWWVTACAQEECTQLTALSVSDLYHSLVVDVCRRYLAKMGELDENKLLDDAMVLDDSRISYLLETLGCWAFEGLRQDTAQLPIAWLKGVQDDDENPTLLSTNRLKQLNVCYLKELGLLKQVSHGIKAQATFEFLHLSFQEFLVANVIAMMLRTGTEAQKICITHVIHAYKYHSNFTLVWPMVSGLLKEYPETLNDFLSHLIAGPRDWVGFVEFDLLMRCLESSLTSSTNTSVLGARQRDLLWAIRQQFQQFNKLPRDWQESTLEILSAFPALIRLNADAIVTFLQDEMVPEWVRCKLAINTVASLSETLGIMEVVFTFLRSETAHGEVRCELAKIAIASLSKTPGFIEAVVAFLQDKNVARYIRCELAKSAAISLSEESRIVDVVVKLLWDEEMSGRGRCALAKSAIASLSEHLDFLDAVAMLLRHKSVSGKFRYELARSAFALLPERSGILEAIFTLLRGERVAGPIRSKLVKSAVESLPEQPGFVEVIAALLRDENVAEWLRYDLVINTVALLSKAPDVMEAVVTLLRDKNVAGRFRFKLAKGTIESLSAVALLSKTPGIMEAVVTLLRDESVARRFRCALARSAIASLSEHPGFVEAVAILLRGEGVTEWFRCALVRNAVAPLSSHPSVMEAVITLLRDQRVDKRVRCKLAKSAIALLSEYPDVVAAIVMLLRDERVYKGVYCELTKSAVTSLSKNHGIVAAVATFLQDQGVDGKFRGKLAISAVASLSQHHIFVEALLALFQDQHVDGKVRCCLVNSAIVSLSGCSRFIEAVLALFRDESVEEWARCDLAISTIASFSKHPSAVDAVIMLLRSQSAAGRVRGNLARSAVACLSERPDFVKAVVMLLQDERVAKRVRCDLAKSVVASLSEQSDFMEEVVTLLQDSRVDRWVRCELAKSAVALLSGYSRVMEAVVTLLQDQSVVGEVRCELVGSVVASLPEYPGVMGVVVTLLRDESVAERIRCNLTRSAAASLLKYLEFEAVVKLLQDERVGGRVRCELARSVVASLSEYPDVSKDPSVMEAVVKLLQDERVGGKVRCELARSVVASLSEYPGFMGAVVTLLRDESVAERVRCDLTRSAAASLSKPLGLVEAVVKLLRDKRVSGRVRCEVARSVVASLSEYSGIMEVVFTLLQDQNVDKWFRGELAKSAVASLSEQSGFVEAVTMLLQDQNVDKWFRGELARIVCRHCAKWPDKISVFFKSLFVEGHNEKELSRSVDILVHVILPLYNKTHEKGRQYMIEQLIERRVLVYEQLSTVIIVQAGQTERSSLSQSTIQQIKQALQPYCPMFGGSASTLSNQGFFATSTTTNSSSLQRIRGWQLSKKS